jgi:sialic acid synthase SpsE
MSSAVAPADSTYITAEIVCGTNDAVYGMSKEEIIAKTAQQIELVGLSPRADCFDAYVHTEDYVYPLQYRGYHEELARTRAAITKYQQIYTIGNAAEFHYADIQIVFHKAFDTAHMLCGKDSSFTQVIRQTPRCIFQQRLTINNRTIGDGGRAYIIAEAGLNHNGSIDMAKQLIDAAYTAGCDAVKFQTFKASSRISKKVKAARYAETIIGLEETLYEMFERLSLSPESQRELFEYARKKGIEIFSTPFDNESVDFLETMGVSLYKIASMDLVNLPLITAVAKTGKTIFLSTGMSTLGQIEEALDAIASAGNPHVILLHCNSSYPAAPEEMNLNVIHTLRQCFNVPVGLSDHTLGLFASHTALAMGVDAIERHFTLDKMLEGPDHMLSSDPEEMAHLVHMSKIIPSLKGSGVKRIQPNEYDTLNTQRKSLYAAVPLKSGELITRDKIAIRGPGGGLLPRYINIVIGRNARRDIEEDYPITWEDI